MASFNTDLNPVDFFVPGCLKFNVHHDGKPDVRHQLLESRGEAADIISNKWHASNG